MNQIPAWARLAQSGWRHDGRKRPDFALEPGPGQESVWDYPRPPRLVLDARSVVVRAGDQLLARTTRALRLLETASPPTFYLHPDDIEMRFLHAVGGGSRCEWKGEAQYYDVVLADRTLQRVAWSYPNPFAPYESMAGFVSLYPAALECFVNDERVRPQPGGFYGGWVTDEIVGPIKGEAGTGGW